MLTETHTTAEPIPGNGLFDLADLVALALSSTAPDRDLDLLIEAMLGRREVVMKIDRSGVKALFWMRAQVPHYTAGGAAIRKLAHVRGLALSSVRNGDIWTVTVADPHSGEKFTVSHTLEGVAGLAAVAAVVARR